MLFMQTPRVVASSSKLCCETLLLLQLLLRLSIEHDLQIHFERRLLGNGPHLKLHLMRLVTRPQAEVAGEVATEELLFLDRRE